jgi:hypothetical protein
MDPFLVSLFDGLQGEMLIDLEATTAVAQRVEGFCCMCSARMRPASMNQILILARDR